MSIRTLVRDLYRNSVMLRYTYDTNYDTVPWTTGNWFVHARRVIFFRADFWHCGGPFRTEHPRFHGFQLPPTLHVPGAVYN